MKIYGLEHKGEVKAIAIENGKSKDVSFDMEQLLFGTIDRKDFESVEDLSIRASWIKDISYKALTGMDTELTSKVTCYNDLRKHGEVRVIYNSADIVELEYEEGINIGVATESFLGLLAYGIKRIKIYPYGKGEPKTDGQFLTGIKGTFGLLLETGINIDMDGEYTFFIENGDTLIATEGYGIEMRL